MLPPSALRWVAHAVAPGAEITSVQLLGGATSSELHALTVSLHGHTLDLVLRRFTNQQWLKEEPDLVRHEAAALAKASGAGVPVPELVAHDETGEYCGAPAVLMTRLPGTVLLTPDSLDRWLHQFAEAIYPFHTLDPGDYPWRYFTYNDVKKLRVPAWSHVPELWERTIAIVQGPWPAARECFIHRDYHPNNVLFAGQRLSGVIDWPNACRGAAGIDVAWCRGNLQGMYGVEVADRFLHAYEAVAGASFTYDPFWDLITIIEGLPGPPGIYPPWEEFGIRDLTAEIMRERDDAYLASVIARL